MQSRESTQAILLLTGTTVLTAVPLVGNGSITGLILAMTITLVPILLTSLRNRQLILLWLTAVCWMIGQAYANYAADQIYLTYPLYVGYTIALLASGLFAMVVRLKIQPLDLTIAFSLGWILLKLSTGVLDTSNPWKYGLSTPIAILLLATCYRCGYRYWGIINALAALAVVSRIFDNRIQTALFAIAAVTVLVIGNKSRANSRTRSALIAILTVGTLLYLAYPSLAIEGWFGQRAEAQQTRDNENDADFLLSIRKELPMTAYLASRNLPVGIGSYSTIGVVDTGEALAFVERFTGPIAADEIVYLSDGLELRPVGYKAHSEAFSAILYGGILAAPFWIWLVYYLIRGISCIGRKESIAPAIILYVAGTAMWDLLFSPMNNNTHLVVGFAIFIIAINQKTASTSQSISNYPRGEANNKILVAREKN